MTLMLMSRDWSNDDWFDGIGFGDKWWRAIKCACNMYVQRMFDWSHLLFMKELNLRENWKMESYSLVFKAF